jgi:hypothetical protein
MQTAGSMQVLLTKLNYANKLLRFFTSLACEVAGTTASCGICSSSLIPLLPAGIRCVNRWIHRSTGLKISGDIVAILRYPGGRTGSQTRRSQGSMSAIAHALFRWTSENAPAGQRSTGVWRSVWTVEPVYICHHPHEDDGVSGSPSVLGECSVGPGEWKTRTNGCPRKQQQHGRQISWIRLLTT